MSSRTPAGLILFFGLLAVSSVQVAAETVIEYVDKDGDHVALKHEAGSPIRLYGNGELLMEHATIVRREGNKIFLATPDGGMEAETTIPPGEEHRLESILALMSSVEGPQDPIAKIKASETKPADEDTIMEVVEMVSAEPSEAESQESEVEDPFDKLQKLAAEEPEKTLPGTLLEYKDADGDSIEIKREEGGWMNLYGNGQLALEKVYIKKIEGRTLFLGSAPGTGTAHIDGETTIPEGQDDVLARAKAFFQEQQARFAEQQRSSAQHVEEFLATINMITSRAAKVAAQQKGDQKPKARRSPFFIDTGDSKGDADGATAVARKEEKSIVTSDPQRSVLDLNRFNFNSAVLSESGGDVAEHWVVLFCYSWWKPCQEMREPYLQQGTEWQVKLNTGLFTQTVRFAQVDCATDRVLCNERGVEGFPHVQHYTKGAMANKWNGGQANDLLRLSKWLQKRLGSLAPEDMPARESDQVSLWAVWKEAIGVSLPAGLLQGSRVTTDLLIVLVVVALNVRAVCSNPSLWEPASEATAAVNQPKETLGKGPCTAALPQAQPCAETVARSLPMEWAQTSVAAEL